MKKSLRILSIITSISALVSACAGVFYSFGGSQRTTENIYGQKVALFGDGIYANDSIMKAGVTKGTDLTIIAVSLLLLCVVLFFYRKKHAHFLHCGLLSILFMPQPAL